MTHTVYITAHGEIINTKQTITIPSNIELICFGPINSELSSEAQQQLTDILTELNKQQKENWQHELKSLWLIPGDNATDTLYRPKDYNSKVKAPCFQFTKSDSQFGKNFNWRTTTIISSPNRYSTTVQLDELLKQQLERRKKDEKITIIYLGDQIPTKGSYVTKVTINKIVTNAKFKLDHKNLLQAIRSKNKEEAKQILAKYNYSHVFADHQFGAGEITALHVAYRHFPEFTNFLIIFCKANEYIKDALHRLPIDYQPVATLQKDQELPSGKKDDLNSDDSNRYTRGCCML